MSDIPPRLRDAVRERAGGKCEYCRIPESVVYARHEIDHIIAQKHGGETTHQNLSLCCWICNRHKGTDLASIDPDTGAITALFHPRQQVWEEHFRLDEGIIVPLTPTGRVTVRLLQLNRRDRVLERRQLLD